MPFTLPTFNLTINIWTSPAGPPGAPTIVTTGNLQFGRKRANNTFGSTTFLAHQMWLLLPALTDVRGDLENNPLQGDTVEVPAGSGRFYFVRQVDDVAKGFLNEYRVAIIQQLQAFPVPIP